VGFEEAERRQSSFLSLLLQRSRVGTRRQGPIAMLHTAYDYTRVVRRSRNRRGARMEEDSLVGSRRTAWDGRSKEKGRSR
jgi:hypothetical protein